MKVKNHGMFIAFILFTMINIFDTITAFFILKGEANPIFLLTGSIWPIILLKLGITCLLGYYIIRNIYPSNLMYYLVCIIMILGSLVISIAVLSNILGILNPETLEKAAAMPQEEKLEQYGLFILIFYLIPGVAALLPFLLYNYTLKNAIIDKKFFKKKNVNNRL